MRHDGALISQIKRTRNLGIACGGMKRAHDRRARGGDTRARESDAAEESPCSRFEIFRKKSGRREGGRAQFSTLPPENAVGSSLCSVAITSPLHRESPAIYGNRKNANKGSLALYSCCSLVLRALRKGGDTARGKRERGQRDGVNGSSRFSYDARLLRRNK